jgi:hypothetical protein
MPIFMPVPSALIVYGVFFDAMDLDAMALSLRFPTFDGRPAAGIQILRVSMVWGKK